MDESRSVRFAVAAGLTGLAWGYLRHRRDPRAPLIALLQAAEWFVAYGGATALIARARAALEKPLDEPDEEVERIIHIRQVVSERTGTEG